MGYIIRNEELQAEAVLPDPFTGNHYARYQRAFEGEGNVLEKSIRAALAVVESCSYHEHTNGSRVDLVARGWDADLSVLIWLQLEVSNYIGEKLRVPKALSSKPSAPPTEAEPLLSS